MDFLKIRTKLAPLLICLFLANTGCQLTYYAKSAYNQMSILNQRVPLEKVLQDEKISAEYKVKILLAQKAKEFAEEKLSLKKSASYSTYVGLNRPYATYVVSAAPKWELKHHHWSYLFVGEMPYKGFFSLDEAKEEEESLKKQNLDTYLRGVSAYSTLGWFNDPILSSMMGYADYDLVNTIIHETVHATLYIKNSADFNERMAVFLGNKGAELFYLDAEGKNSATLKEIQNENEDDKKFSEFISTELNDLTTWYKAQKEQTEDLRIARIKEIQARFSQQLQPKLTTKAHDYFAKIELNNARLNLYKTYFQDLSDFEKLFVKVNGNFVQFLEACKKLEKHEKPEVGLKEMIGRRPL